MLTLPLLFTSFRINARELPEPLNSFNIQCFGAKDGLPQESITDIALLPDGRLLISSYAGLMVFDGSRFTDMIPNSENNFPHIESFNIDVNNKGYIWIGTTTTGAYGIFENQIHHYDMENGLDSNFVFEVLALENGALIITDASIFQVNLTNHMLTKVDISQFELKRNNFFKGENGELLFADVKGIWEFKDNQWLAKIKYDDDQRIEHRTVLGLNSNEALIAQFDKVVKVSSKGITNIIPEFFDNKIFDISDIMMDSKESIWLATNQKGLLRFSKRGLEKLDKFPSNRIASILEDVDGVIWAATTAGLCYLKSSAIKSYGKHQGLLNEYIEYIAIDSHEQIFVLPYPPTDNYFKIINNKAYSIETHLNKYQKGDRIHAITTDENETVWAASTNNIGIIENDVLIPKFSINHRIRGLVVENETFWYEDGNYLIKKKNSIDKKISLNEENEIVIVSISQAYNGDIVVAEKSGAYRIVNDKAIPLEIPLKASACIREFIQDELWVCSKGLWLRSNNHNYYFGYEQGLTDGQVHEVINDNQGNIWAATNSGLYRILRKDIESVLSGKKTDKVFERFSEKDGMKSSELNGSGNSAVKTSDGRLWFAGQGGITVVDPELALFKSDKKLTPYVEELIIDNQVVSPKQWSKIQPNPENVKFQFGAIHLSDAKNLSFRYMFLPEHNQWTNGDTLNFSQLPYGEYELHLQVKLHQNKWSETTIQNFHVVPAWYQSWWFKIFASLVILMLIFGLPMWRINRLNKKSVELEILVDERTALLTQANEKLYKQSHKDALTNIANRRELIDQIEKLIRQNKNICLALIDIDDFKAYNDFYGHIAGDDCLIKVANLLDSTPSEDCIAARFGGEEFVLLFNSVKLVDAGQTIIDILEKLEKMAFPHQESSVSDILTLSIGLVENKKGEKVGDLINRADMLMYKAKANGKNNLVVN